MKYIILLIISIFLVSTSFVSATELKPSLMKQMVKQEKINKKNDVQNRLFEQEQKRIEAKSKLAALQYQRLVLLNASKSISVVKPTVVSQQLPVSNLTISRPIVVNQAPVQITDYSTNIVNPPNVDMSRVRSTWIGWYNNVREGQGLAPYTYDTRLDMTAYDWNQVFAKNKGLNHHTRNPGDGYYNFAVIDNWFIAHGINPTVINKTKHTENVGYGSYTCKSSDCTDSLVRSIRSTFDFFVSEKGKPYDPHYRSIVQPYFTKIGLSIIVIPEEQRYYLTVHYITK